MKMKHTEKDYLEGLLKYKFESEKISNSVRFARIGTLIALMLACVSLLFVFDVYSSKLFFVISGFMIGIIFFFRSGISITHENMLKQIDYLDVNAVKNRIQELDNQ